MLDPQLTHQHFTPWTGSADAAISYLMFANSGGAVATLSFMGAMKTGSPIPRAPVMLAAFIAGFIRVGALRAIHYHRMTRLFDHWRADVSMTYNDKLPHTKLIERDEKRAKEAPLADVVGWLSFGCFVVGTVIGYFGMFNLRK